MPKITGVFEIFPDLDLILPSDIAKWSNEVSLQPLTIENHIANRILYPQVAPVKPEDLRLDLALLREALKRSPSFYKAQERKLIIPISFTERFGGIQPLIFAYVDAYKPPDITQVVTTNGKLEKIIGSVVTPLFTKIGSSIDLSVEEKLYRIKQGSLMVLPCPKERCHIIFKSSDATLVSKKDNVLEAFGGTLGIVVDAR
jgi:hypothetical protein